MSVDRQEAQRLLRGLVESSQLDAKYHGHVYEERLAHLVELLSVQASKALVDKEELLLVIEMLAKRADESEAAAREQKGYSFHRLNGQAYAYREAERIIHDTVNGVSWKALRNLKAALRDKPFGA